MQAALMYGPNDIRVEEIDRPECPEGGFVLKVMAVGLCGSDIRNLTTDSKSGKYPHIYGHEITGIVDEVSPSCKEYNIGDQSIGVRSPSRVLKISPAEMSFGSLSNIYPPCAPRILLIIPAFLSFGNNCSK